MSTALIDSPFYEVTNSIASLWLARDFIDDECLIMNADVYWTEKILDAVLSDKNTIEEDPLHKNTSKISP